MTSLRLSPLASLHWQFLAHIVDTEATAFGITSENDGLLVERLWIPKQECSVVTTDTDDGEFNELAEWAYDNGIKPSQIGKIWLHTHPGSSPNPSGTDETTFKEKFGNCDWAVMGILAKGGDDYARVKFKAGGGCSFTIPIITLWKDLSKSMPDLAALAKDWEQEVKDKIRERKWITTNPAGKQEKAGHWDNTGQWVWNTQNSSWNHTEWVKKRDAGSGSEAGSKIGNPHSGGKMSELVGPNAGKSLFLDDFDVEIITTKTVETDPTSEEIYELDEADKDKLEVLQEFEEYMNKAYGVRVDDLTTDQLMDGYKDFCESFGYEFDLDDIFPERAEYHIEGDKEIEDYSEYEVFDICMDCGITKQLTNGYCEGCLKARSSEESIHDPELYDKPEPKATDLVPLCRVS